MYRGLKDLVYLAPLFLAGVLLVGSAQMWWLIGKRGDPTPEDFRAAAKVTAIALGLLGIAIIGAFMVRILRRAMQWLWY
jgi:preprotein translocase subunit Sss1